jgi:RNA polymerase sigma-70 factor (ECF subfamily)
MSDGMEAALAEAVVSGHARWPGVVLAPGALAEHVARQSISPEAVRARGADLFLAVACAAGDAAAVGAFEQAHLSQVDSYVTRLDLSPEMLDELRQLVRIRLLVERPPRIAGYRATGPLGGWVRVAAIRVALDLIEASGEGGKRLGGDEVLVAGLAETAPETALLRERCRPVLQKALEEAIAELDERDKAVLRFHYVEGLNVEAIGLIYRVHRATVARWLADLRHRLLRAVQATVAAELLVTPSEFRSLVRSLHEELPLSLGSVLRG